jgi:FkbM family methyltransferase
MLARLARRLGYDLLPRAKVKHPQAQLQLILERGGFDAVIDVGANIGQYAGRLREWGWRGPIVSFEPLPEAHARLTEAAAGDAGWTVAPRMALGAAEGRAMLEVSAESDMSSLLPQNELLGRISPSSLVTGRVEVPVARLDRVGLLGRSDWRRLFLKLDVQGFEPAVIEGAGGLWPRIHGIQIELAVLPVYEGELGWQAMLARLSDLGFEPHLFIPGYFSRSLARLVQMDGVFLRRPEASPLPAS